MNLSMEPTVKNKKILILFILLSILISCLKDDQRTPAEKEMDRQVGMIDDRKTVLGPDNNNNGVRDDIEYWINHAPQIINKDIKQAAMWYAKTQRDIQMHSDDKEKSIKAMSEMDTAFSCLSMILWETKIDFKEDYIYKKIIELSENTRKRSKAYSRADLHFAGQVGPSKNFADETCYFELEGSYRKRMTEKELKRWYKKHSKGNK